MLTPAIADLLPHARRAPIPQKGARLASGLLGWSRVLSLAIVAGLVAAAPAAAEDAAKPNAPRHQAARTDLEVDGAPPDKIVRAGTQTSVATVWDCALPNYAPVVSARVEHGAVFIAKGNGPHCGRVRMSLTDILYRPAPGFRGTDTLTVLGFLTHGDVDQTFTILVK
jgi:hypothetical protein